MSKRPQIQIREPKPRHNLAATPPTVEMPHEIWKQSSESKEPNPSLEQERIIKDDNNHNSLKVNEANSTVEQISNNLNSTSASNNESLNNNETTSLSYNETDLSVSSPKDSQTTFITQATLASRGRKGNKNSSSESLLLKGKTRAVWEFLLKMAGTGNSSTNRVRVSRNNIKEGTGIGSLNTIDQAIIDLQSYGLIKVHPIFGSNRGYEYELLNLTESHLVTSKGVDNIANILVKAADIIKSSDITKLTGDRLKELTKLVYSIQRITNEMTSPRYK
jgi:hypothetical protein